MYVFFILKKKKKNQVGRNLFTPFQMLDIIIVGIITVQVF